MRNNRWIWLVMAGAVLFFGAAVFTLRAAEHAAAAQATAKSSVTSAAPADTAPKKAPSHPPPAAPEETATITDDPTVAPDAAQSADNNVSFPTDI